MNDPTATNFVLQGWHRLCLMWLTLQMMKQRVAVAVAE